VAISSYFYDSVVGDERTYSAADFARAFDIAFETGVLIRETVGGTFGFDIGGTNYTTIYEGKAIIEGHFVEVTGTEILTVPTGSYSGQVVIQMDMEDTRVANLVVKQDRTPIKSSTFYELELWDVTVSNGIITAVTDKRFQGGAVPNNHLHSTADVSGLQAHIDKALTWVADPNGVKCTMGKYAGTGKPIVLFLTSSQPSAVSSEHRVWIQIDNF
jgi:hypothetical protein